MHISDLISSKFFLSFEIYVPKSQSQLSSSYSLIDSLLKYHPLFISVTWRLNHSDQSNVFDICKYIKDNQIEPLMHLTSYYLTENELNHILQQVKEYDIENILALRGDIKESSPHTRFPHAFDMIQYIKMIKPDISLSVAGYPNGHYESSSYEEDLNHLRNKLDVGSDFVITQLFYSIQDFIDFDIRCKNIGIIKPIIPGILPISNYKSFKYIHQLSQIKIPMDIIEQIESLKEDDSKIFDYGCSLITNLCKELIEYGVLGIHFYTINSQRAIEEILKRLEL